VYKLTPPTTTFVGNVLNPDRPRKNYALHHDRQRECILKAGEKLFILNGIEATQITEIAAESGMTRATIYKYFPNKQEIAWEILKTFFEALRDFSELEKWSEQWTGFERVEAFISSLFSFFWEDLDRARFMAQFDQIYAGKWDADRMVNLLRDVLGERNRFLTRAVDEGRNDGSLRSNLNPELVSVTIINLFIGLERRLASMPSHVEAEYGQSVKDIYREACQLVLEGIRETQIGAIHRSDPG
jgi:AcrR family transcriptional regulator